MWSRSWAPGRAAEMSGPSKWSPSAVAESRCGSNAANAGQRRCPFERRARDDRRDEGGHTGRGEVPGDFADRRRVTREVVAPASVDLDVDQPGCDDLVRDVDRGTGGRRAATGSDELCDPTVLDHHVELLQRAVLGDDGSTRQLQRRCAVGHQANSPARTATTTGTRTATTSILPRRRPVRCVDPCFEGVSIRVSRGVSRASATSPRRSTGSRSSGSPLRSSAR